MDSIRYLSVALLLAVVCLSGTTLGQQQSSGSAKKDDEQKPLSATVKLVAAGNSKVAGELNLTQTGDGFVRVTGRVTGLQPGAHGFHVHEKPDLGDNCNAAGSHFNPTNQTHGAPEASRRHVGDLGNIQADNNGVAVVDIQDRVIQLNGTNNIIGKSIVIHEREDDMGRGGFNDSLTTGHAGARLACGLIESGAWSVVASAHASFLSVAMAIAALAFNRRHDTSS